MDHDHKISVLVTGSNGFIGRHLAPYLASRGYRVIAASRRESPFDDRNIIRARLPDLSTPFDWRPLLQDCKSVVHLAGIAHTCAEEDQYDRINHRATGELAETAHRCGTQLIFVSSIAAQSGSFSQIELTEDDTPRPNNAYGRSKLAAEHAVRTSGTSFTILRPVVVYGDGEKGNFAAVHKIARLPIPLPFGKLTAERSVLSVQNFCSAVELTLTNSRACGEILIVSDRTARSVSDIIARYRANLGRPANLVPMPARWIERFLKVTGQGAIWERIGYPLVARPTKLLALGWEPT
jgi:nucleoside-diphosphate-sugar epimerase